MLYCAIDDMHCYAITPHDVQLLLYCAIPYTALCYIVLWHVHWYFIIVLCYIQLCYVMWCFVTFIVPCHACKLWDLAQGWGGGGNKLTDKFSQTNSFSTPKISDDLLSLVFDRVLSVFCLSEIWYITYMTFLLTKNLYFRKKTPWHVFLVTSYFATQPIALLLEIVRGTDAWAVLHLIFLGDRPPSPP